MFTIKLIYKRIFYLICGLLVGVVCLLASYSAFKNSTVDLKQLDNYTGRVTHATLIKKKVTSNFVLRIENLNQIFGVYDIRKDYSDELSKHIIIGDSITVYYQKSLNQNKINLNVYQIKKSGVNLLPLMHKTKQERTAGLIGSIGGLIILFLSLRGFLKNKLPPTPG
jgi:hypothetical protein